jgi:hypothetical protein
MNILGNEGNNPFDQNLNTTDAVDFTRVDVSGAIIDNSQLATKLYVDTHGGGGGGGNMKYVGTTPATNYIYKALASNGHDAVKSSITDDGSTVTVGAGVTLVCETLKTNLLQSDTITPVELFMNAFEINTNAPINCDYIGSSGNITAIGDITAASFKLPLGFSYDFLKGDGSVDTTVYLPIGTPATVAGYAFNPVQNGTNLPISGTKSYYFTVLLNQATIISGFTLYLNNGSDNFRMGIFRGNLTTGTTITLCGQSAGGPLNTLPPIMNRVAITAVSGQNLNFNSGEYITIAFHSTGITNIFVASPVAVGISVELAWNSTANYANAGFPATLNSTAILGPIQIRPCFELY